MFGDFEILSDDSSSNDWIFFIICSFFTTIVMMNLLIAIVSDKFEQVMSNIVPSQYRQLCELIHEQEIFISLI